MVVLAREWRGFLRSPSTWGILAAVQFVTAWQWLALIEQYQAAAPGLKRLPQAPGLSELVTQPLIMTVALLLLFIVPTLSMQSIAGERRNGTLPLWQSAPLRLGTFVLGKWLGVMSVLAVIWLGVALMCVCLAFGSAVDWGSLASALLGLALFMMAASALGILFSTISSQPMTAALACFTCLVFLWVCDWSGQLSAEPTFFSRISLMSQLQGLTRGLVESTDLAYFLSLTGGALGLAIWWLAGERRGL